MQDILSTYSEKNTRHALSVDFTDFSSLFMPIPDILDELKSRRKNPKLKKNVRENMGDIPEQLLKEFSLPRAVLFRQVGTPNHEFFRFLSLAKRMRLKPLVLEYHGDKFVAARNQYKRSLGKLPIYKGRAANGTDIFQYHTIVDFARMEGKTFQDVRLLDGSSLIEYHHHLISKLSKLNSDKYTQDITRWLEHLGTTARDYYENFLYLFIRDGVLFENYFSTPHERPFVEKVILPAFEKTHHIFGVKPLIVQLVPPHGETRLFWDSYPRKATRMILSM